MRHPAPLRPGSHVRVISPSFPIMYHRPNAARRAEEVMTGLGLRISYGAQATAISDDGRSAGTAQERAADFMEAFTDATVDAVFSAWGGDTAQEILPHLDVDRLRTECKPFIGNSDNVWINHSLWRDAGLSSYYGATYVGEMGEFGGPFPETLDHFRRALMSGDDLVCAPAPRRSSDFRHHTEPEVRRRQLNVDGGWRWIRAGYGCGPLVGAEIGTLVQMAECSDLALDGCVVFWDLRMWLENVEEAYRGLAQLADRTSLDRLAGMLVGPDVRHSPPQWAEMVADIVSSVVPAARYPVVVNADIGHLDPKWVVPYGREVVLDSSRGVVFPRRAG